MLFSAAQCLTFLGFGFEQQPLQCVELAHISPPGTPVSSHTAETFYRYISPVMDWHRFRFVFILCIPFYFFLPSYNLNI